MQLTTHSDYSLGSELLAQHEDATIVGRNDINLMLSKKVEQKRYRLKLPLHSLGMLLTVSVILT